MKWEDKIALNNHLLSLKEKNKNKERKNNKKPRTDHLSEKQQQYESTTNLRAFISFCKLIFDASTSLCNI